MSCDKVLTLLHKEKLTQENKNKAPILADKAAKKGREVLDNVTPKGHVGKIHAPESFITLPSGHFCLLIEQRVERNHQDGKLIEAQHAHIPYLDT